VIHLKSKGNSFADEKVLGELLAFNSAAVGCSDAEIGVQQTRDRLQSKIEII
jgi:hypothetical protein